MNKEKLISGRKPVVPAAAANVVVVFSRLTFESGEPRNGEKNKRRRDDIQPLDPKRRMKIPHFDY